MSSTQQSAGGTTPGGLDHYRARITADQLLNETSETQCSPCWPCVLAPLALAAALAAVVAFSRPASWVLASAAAAHNKGVLSSACFAGNMCVPAPAPVAVAVRWRGGWPRSPHLPCSLCSLNQTHCKALHQQIESPSLAWHGKGAVKAWQTVQDCTSLRTHAYFCSTHSSKQIPLVTAGAACGCHCMQHKLELHRVPVKGAAPSLALWDGGRRAAVGRNTVYASTPAASTAEVTPSTHDG